MYHYSLTSDIRIESLPESMESIAKLYLNNNVPSAQDDKSLNNVANTLGFYFNFRNSGACTIAAANGDIKSVLLNFVKKFQFPNPRSKESGLDAFQDGILIAPLRCILKLLYIFYLNDGDVGYLTQEEITEFIFYNNNVAKSRRINYTKLYEEIISYRNTHNMPSSIAQENERLWKGIEAFRVQEAEYTSGKRKEKPTTNPEKRQIGILISLMALCDCIIWETDGKIKFNCQVEDTQIKKGIFNVMAYDGYWTFNSEISSSDNEKSYYNYMEMDNSNDTDCSSEEIKFNTDLNSEYELNRIVFGAPGTGKSHRLQEDSVKLLGEDGMLERVTFHPDYSYANFVGTYKPISETITKEDGTQSNEITYKFVPGPFMRVLVAALKNAKTDNALSHLLLIEEINRAKVAAVFGDVFQLLDRDNSGISEYKIHASEDIRKYLAEELKIDIDNCKEIAIPNNMFIWATMNSADQGVFPMDTAFKRRWSFEYIGIDEEDKNVYGLIYIAGKEIEWNQLRKAINKKLTDEYSVNEDKLIGPYFLSKKIVETEEVTATDGQVKKLIKNTDLFTESFKSKVLMYLYEDAAKQHKKKMFSGCSKYSDVCHAFDQYGIKIFGDDFEMLYEEQGV